jgi:hypothetical protein
MGCALQPKKVVIKVPFPGPRAGGTLGPGRSPVDLGLPPRSAHHQNLGAICFQGANETNVHDQMAASRQALPAGPLIFGEGCDMASDQAGSPTRRPKIAQLSMSRNTKEPLPFGSGSSTVWDCKSPVYAVEATSRELTFVLGALCMSAMPRTARDAPRANAPSACHTWRQRVASMSRMVLTSIPRPMVATTVFMQIEGKP